MVNENDLGEILAQELERIKECGERINLAEIERRTGISRAVLRRWQSNGYVIQPSRKGWRSKTSKFNDVSETMDTFERTLDQLYKNAICISFSGESYWERGRTLSLWISHPRS